MDNLSLSDISAVLGNGGVGGGSMWVIIILFLLIFGGGGFGNRGLTDATTNEILMGQKFQGLDNKADRLGGGIADATFALQNSITTEGRNTQAQLATCCCENQKNVDSVRFDMSNYAASINSASAANTQKILDAIGANRLADMQNRINQLELQNALAGVVRYPTATAYCSGNNPFASGCGCGV